MFQACVRKGNGHNEHGIKVQIISKTRNFFS